MGVVTIQTRCDVALNPPLQQRRRLAVDLAVLVNPKVSLHTPERQADRHYELSSDRARRFRHSWQRWLRRVTKATCRHVEIGIQKTEKSPLSTRRKIQPEFVTLGHA